MGAEVLLHGGIHSLGLTVGLQVEGGAKSPIDAEPIAELLPEGCRELWTAVGDYAIRQAVEAEDVLDKHTCQIGRIHSSTTGDEMTCLVSRSITTQMAS